MLITDVFVSGGPNDLYKCWTDKVSKFDTSSFYNWEEDNLPLFDLEERTHLLWERLGYPTSAITGMSFIVSAGATETCNPLYFTSISSCLAALPEVINFPVLIEVASFGDLGSINLSNKIAGPRGAIEIVNRNFVKAFPLSEDTHLTTEISDGSTYQYANSLMPAASAIQLALDLGIAYPSIGFAASAAKMYSNDQLIASAGTADSRYAIFTTTVYSRPYYLEDNNRLSVALASKNDVQPFQSWNAPGNWATDFNVYENNADAQDSISTYDASCINEYTGNEIVWATNRTYNGADALSPGVSVANVYFNKLSSISVVNCNLPLYIRNFCVDGGGYNGNVNNGITIKNSTVVLDSVSVSRCRKAGLHAENSDVTLIRGFNAYRNYSFDASGNRIGTAWNDKVRSYKKQSSYGAGIRLKNSHLTVSSTYDLDRQVILDSLNTNYPLAVASVSSLVSPPSWLYCLSKNDIGIDCENSTITGGKNEIDGVANATLRDASQFIFELNTECGIRAENATIENSGRLMFYGNYIGVDANSSKLYFDVAHFRFNQKEALKLKNSYLQYNKDLYAPYSYAAPTYSQQTNRYIHQLSFLQNGTHILAENSILEPVNTLSMPTIYDMVMASASFGVTDFSNEKFIKPAIIVDNNSKVELVKPLILDILLESNKASYGAAIAVTNNSELYLRGTSDKPTRIYGPANWGQQKNAAGLYAGNSSNIKISGPTVIARFGVDILADGSSKIDIIPHRDSNNNLLVDEYLLSSAANHTMVELHSSRACVVVDHDSVFNAEDLGDYRYSWAEGAYGSGILASSLDYLTTNSELATSAYTYKGSLQFYPNPNDVNALSLTTHPTLNAYDGTTTFIQDTRMYRFLTQIEGGEPTSLSAVTLGGMCLRALNGSKVNITNVNFPCGFWNPSALVYDASSPVGADLFCNRLFIWNIADNSLLNANYLSVSGLHPVDAGYVGPSGVYGNTVSSAPSSTPDTGILSILDYYGRRTVGTYQNASATNFGPFRLYWSIDPAAHWLVTQTNFQSGLIPQVFAQGYNFSGNCLASGSASSEYFSLLRNNNGVIQASGFYYPSSMVVSPNTIKAVLDESAANTFANAKHNSVGKSGLAKVVSMYYPYTEVYIGDSASSGKTWGEGLRSVNVFDLEKTN